MSLTVYYHVYADGSWREPVDEFLAALGPSFSDVIHVGIVGRRENREAVIERMTVAFALDVVAESERGFEQATLIPLSRAVKHLSGNVLYAHTKGSSDTSDFNAQWRRSMTELVVRDRRRCCSMIYTRGYDAVGCHWLVPEQWQGLVTAPMFGGNFWIATTRYLRRLGRVQTRHRHQAEEWVGSGVPRPFVCDLSPGWPNESIFRKSVTA